MIDTVVSGRRQYPRYPMNRRVTLFISDWTSFQAFSEDISNGGVRLRMPRATAVGEQLVVQLQLPNQLQLDLSGEVRHVQQLGEEYSVGLSWTDLQSDEIQLLDALIAEVETQTTTN